MQYPNPTLLLLLSLSLLLPFTSPKCPSSCNCTANTYQCIQCLQKYKRVYSLQCVCFNDYVEKKPQQDYCCPPNCASCNELGCTSCDKNFQLEYDNNLECYLCKCLPNYQLKNGTCVCKAISQPKAFYQNRQTGECKVCPVGCVCDEMGCGGCSEDLKRIVRVDFLGYQSCECSAPYIDWYDVCRCYPDCTCENDVLKCDYESSHRIQDDKGKWVCQYGFRQINNHCQCTFPYQYSSITNQPHNKACVCTSYFLVRALYQYKGQCLQCPQGCSCDQRGCYRCSPTLNRQLKLFSCKCKSPYVEFKRLCICVQPYYLVNGECKCLAFYDLEAYVWDEKKLECLKCPEGCRCNASGCVSCGEGSLRRVVNAGGLSKCPCVMSAVEGEGGKCGCNQFAVEGKEVVNGSNVSVCVCQENSNIYNESGTCRICPDKCTCSSDNGCISCEPSAHRIINSTSVPSQCPCQSNYTQVSGVCQCQPPFSWDSYTQSCQCFWPYTFRNGLCTCQSTVSPTTYYLDLLSTSTPQCYLCPVGCTCNSSGCYNCYQYSLRHNVWNGTFMHCPCMQHAFLRYDWVCTMCPDQSYFFSNSCIPCLGCAKCDAYGCLECFQGAFVGMTEEGYECLCYNQSLVNANGTCTCGSGQYKDAEDGVCRYCPLNCLDCKYNSGNITCISCRYDTYRHISPQTNCPCLDGYLQLGKIAAYCCPITCSDCDSLGCTSCPVFSHRQLHNHSCVCKSNLIDIGDINCTCPMSFYLENNSCSQCPWNCQSCVYMMDQDEVFCLSCMPNRNRRDIPELGCPCEQGFVQGWLVVQFCIVKHCAHYAAICNRCYDGRIPSPDGKKCLCPKGFYQGSYETCKKCIIHGCLDCTSYSFCVQCDLQNGYYLANTTCRRNMEESEYLYSQSTRGISLQIKTYLDTKRYDRIYEVKAYLEKVIEHFQANTTVNQAYVMNIREKSITQGDTITLKMDSPVLSLQNQMMTITYVLIPSTSNLSSNASSDNLPTTLPTTTSSTFSGISGQLSIHLPHIYSESILSQTNNPSYITTEAFLLILLLYQLIVYIRGFKHNEMVFFMQTMAFLGLVMDDKQLEIIPFLYNLKPVYYGVGNLLEARMPVGYMENGWANFSIFTGDGNIFRVAGTTICVAIITCLVTLLCRLSYQILKIFQRAKHPCYLNNKNPLRFLFIHRKYPYRLFQFLYKTCMYPLLFFSICTVRKWQGGVLASQHYHGFLMLSRGCAVTFLVVYFVTTVWSVTCETIAKVNRIENLMEYVCGVANSVILVYTAGSRGYLLIILIMLCKTTVYLITRRKYLRDFQKIQYLSILSFVLQTLTISLLKPLLLTIALLSLTLLCCVIHSETVLYFTNSMAESGKRVAGNVGEKGMKGRRDSRESRGRRKWDKNVEEFVTQEDLNNTSQNDGSVVNIVAGNNSELQMMRKETEEVQEEERGQGGGIRERDVVVSGEFQIRRKREEPEPQPVDYQIRSEVQHI